MYDTDCYYTDARLEEVTMTLRSHLLTSIPRGAAALEDGNTVVFENRRATQCPFDAGLGDVCGDLLGWRNYENGWCAVFRGTQLIGVLNQLVWMTWFNTNARDEDAWKTELWVLLGQMNVVGEMLEDCSPIPFGHRAAV